MVVIVVMVLHPHVTAAEPPAVLVEVLLVPRADLAPGAPNEKSQSRVDQKGKSSLGVDAQYERKL